MAISHLTCLKILDTIQPNLGSRIILPLSGCISSIEQASLETYDKIKLVDEVDRVGSALLLAPTARKIHWTSQLPESYKFASFLHLAVAAQLDFYVIPKLAAMSVSTEQTELLNDLLRFAVLRFGELQGVFSHNDPSIPIIQKLLEHGADPIVAFRVHEAPGSNVNTAWNDILMQHKGRPALIDLLHEHGAGIQKDAQENLNSKTESSKQWKRRKNRLKRLPWLLSSIA
jgi:hypothetical protein